MDPLTAREIEVLALLSSGQTNREMARLLMISGSTVKTHVQHILRKLGASSRTEAAVMATRRHLIDPAGDPRLSRLLLQTARPGERLAFPL